MKPPSTNRESAASRCALIRRFFHKLLFDRFRYRRQLVWQALQDIFFELLFTPRLPKVHQKRGCLLLVRLDAIGDYILFRNFIEVLKNSEKYAQYSITLCGNILWRDLAEALDSEFVDHFIWVDRGRFRNSLFYRFDILRQIRRSGFSVAIHPVFSRDFYWGDQIIRHSQANLRIGFNGDCTNMQTRQKIESDKYYTNLIRDEVTYQFEFERNKVLFEACLKSSIRMFKPKIALQKKHEFKNSIVIFPGASQVWKQWPATAYAETCSFLLKKTQSEFLICGSPADKELAEHIRTLNSQWNRIKNFAGKTSLLELAQILASCRLLISNDTSAVHIAAAVGTKAIVAISAGNHYGRFLPYPHVADQRMACVFPYPIQKMPEKERLRLYYNSGIGTSIKTIEVERVVAAIRHCGIKC